MEDKNSSQDMVLLLQMVGKMQQQVFKDNIERQRKQQNTLVVIGILNFVIFMGTMIYCFG